MLYASDLFPQVIHGLGGFPTQSHYNREDHEGSAHGQTALRCVVLLLQEPYRIVITEILFGVFSFLSKITNPSIPSFCEL